MKSLINLFKILFIITVFHNSLPADTLFEASLNALCQKDSSTIVDSLKEMTKSLTSIYADYKSSHRSLAGRLGLYVTIGQDGSIIKIRYTKSKSTISDTTYILKVIGAVNTWKVQPLTNACNPIKIFFPLSFAGAGEVVGSRVIRVVSNKLSKVYKKRSRHWNRAMKMLDEELDSLYLHTITFNKTFTGILTITFTISPEGHCNRIDSLKSTFLQPSFNQNVINIIAQYKFLYLAGSKVSLTFSFDDLRGPFAVLLKYTYYDMQYSPMFNRGAPKIPHIKF